MKKILCYVFGHKWKLWDCYDGYREDPDYYKKECSRCGEIIEITSLEYWNDYMNK